MSQNIGINWANLNTGRKARHESTAFGDIVKWANKQKIQSARRLWWQCCPSSLNAALRGRLRTNSNWLIGVTFVKRVRTCSLFATLKSRLDAWPKQVSLIVENPAAKPTGAYYKAAFEKAVEDFKVHLGDWRRLGAGPVGTVFKIQHGNKKNNKKQP